MTYHGTEQDQGDTVTSVCQGCRDHSCRNYSHRQELEEKEEEEDSVSCQEAALAQSKTRDCYNGSEAALGPAEEDPWCENCLTDEDIDKNVAAAAVHMASDTAHLSPLGDQCLLMSLECGHYNPELEQGLTGELGGRGQAQALGEEKNSCLFVVP